MRDSPSTQPSLLVGLRDRSDRECWSRFVDLYGPLVYGYLRKRGVQDADAADLTQQVLMSVSGAISSFEYDPARGSFRAWLFTIVQNRLCDHLRQGTLHRGVGGTAAYERLLEQAEAANGCGEEWERAYERRLFQVAASKVRKDVQQTTWQAFWQTAVEGRSPGEVAESLGTSVAAVYMSKRRVIARIKKRVAYLEGDSR